MKVTSVRYGFATNSSSSHSVITGVPSWAKKTKEQIAEEFNPVRYDYDEISSLDDVVSAALVCTLSPYFYSQHNFETQSQLEFITMTSAFSEEIKKIVLKFDHADFKNNFFNLDLEWEPKNYDYDDADPKVMEENFWNFVYSITGSHMEDY